MRVSVIMPVYGVSDYVERCLRSVMRQTYTDIECIIVDDATPDDSIQKCERLIAGYSGPIIFSIISHKQNRGLSAARNTGTEAATGEYVYYLDSDDELLPESIEKLMTVALDNPDVEMVMGNSRTYWIDEIGDTMMHGEIPPKVDSKDMIMELNLKHLIPVSAWNKLIKRSFLQEHHVSFREGILHEDDLWQFYVIKYLTGLCVVQDVTYNYRKRPGSIVTGSASEKVGKSLAVRYEEVLENLTEGYERLELKRYVDGFAMRYLNYKKTIPEYNGLYKVFVSRSRQYKSIYSLLILSAAGFAGLFCNPIKLLTALHNFRWKCSHKMWKRRHSS